MVVVHSSSIYRMRKTIINYEHFIFYAVAVYRHCGNCAAWCSFNLTKTCNMPISLKRCLNLTMGKKWCKIPLRCRLYLLLLPSVACSMLLAQHTFLHQRSWWDSVGVSPQGRPIHVGIKCCNFRANRTIIRGLTIHAYNRCILQYSSDYTRNVGKCPTWWPPCRLYMAPSVQRRKFWLTPTTKVPCSNLAKTRNPLNLLGCPNNRTDLSR